MNSPHATLKIMFAGGGTGGHLYPAIAIADRITALLKGKRPIEIKFVGTRQGIEYRQKDSLGYPLELINIRGISRSLSLKNLIVPILMLSALVHTSRIISRFNPHLVVGTGGYVSWPVVKAGILKNIPVVLQEQNSFPGLVTRKMAAKAERVYLGFAGAKDHLSKPAHTIVTGNPVRPTITGGNRDDAMKQFNLNPDRKTILVLGGSQGARAINHSILDGLKDFSDNQKFQLLWQTGKRDYKDVEATAGTNSDDFTLFPFENNMSMVYAATDIAIVRAGALTLAELQACAIPSILVPFPHAAGNHQEINAREYVRSGFSEMILQRDIEEQNPLRTAVELLNNGRADEMRENLKGALSENQSAVDIICQDMLGIIGYEAVSEEVSEC